ncbi:MAG: CPBP family intramembrane glutamic endopeptidase [Candidatus Omnitrophota bacterium]
MNRLNDLIKRERLYILLLIFIILVNVVIAAVPDSAKEKARKLASLESGQPQKAKTLDDEMLVKRKEMEEKFKEEPGLAMVFGMVSLLIVAVLLLGIFVLGALVSVRLSRKKIDIATYVPQPVKWGILDVAKVAILCLFFGYMVTLTESALVRIFSIIKNDNFRMVVNSSILDTLVIVFILYFAVGQYKEKLASLGISAKNFSRNVFYGIVGYIAAVPILVAILIITVAVITALKYMPEKQPIVELFLKEKNAPLLIFTTLFAAIAGPVVEELFFRGFMYNALKKRAGIIWAMLITAAVFAGLHAHLVGFLPIMVLGIVLAYLYEKTGTLVSSITVHIMHNLGMVMLVLLTKMVSA